MSYTTIQSLLDTQLQTVVGLPVVQLENTRYEPKTGTPFVRPTFMPVEALRLSTDYDLANGLYTIDLFYPIDKGNATASAMADLIKDAFSRSIVLTSGDVRVHVTMSYRDMARTFQQFYQCPILVLWECQLPKA